MLKTINKYLIEKNRLLINEDEFLIWLQDNQPETGSVLTRLPNKKDWLSIKVELIKTK